VTRTRRIQILIGLGLVAMLAVVLAIALGGGGGDDPAKTPTTSTTESGSPVAELFAGIPSSGMTLGSADAKATLEEFVDPQCPFCARFARQVLPTVIPGYVRPGKVRTVLRVLAFLGPDSQKAARAVVAAGFQDKAWPYMEILFLNQGLENSGYVTDEYLRKLGAQVEGLDVDRMMTDREDPRVDRVLAADKRRAEQLGVNGTPTFVLDKGDGAPKQIESNLEPRPFTQTLDQALAGT
jgi:protein-disulfide isomerase